MRTQKIVFGGTTLVFAYPCLPWTYGKVGVGAGWEESAAGVPSVWVTRKESSLSMRLRITEAEWPTFSDFLDYAQAGGSFAWYPDASTGTFYTCYLLSPKIDEEVKPDRTEFPGVMELTIKIRRTDGAALEIPFYV